VYAVDLLGLVLALGAAPSVAPPPMEVVRPARKIVGVH